MTTKQSASAAGGDPADASPYPTAVEAARARAGAVFEAFMARVQTQRVPAILEIGISMAQVKVLHAVFAAGRIHGGELAQRVGTTPSTISGLVDRLVEQGLLHRADDPMDRRQVVISVTPAGSDLIDRFRELNRQMLDVLLGRIPDADLATVVEAFEILDRAAAGMTADAGSAESSTTLTGSAVHTDPEAQPAKGGSA